MRGFIDNVNFKKKNKLENKVVEFWIGPGKV